MRAVPLFALLAAACVGPSGSPMPEAMTDDGVAPPPGTLGLHLDVHGPLDPAGELTFRVRGAAPGQRVWIVRGTAFSSREVCPGPLGGTCVDLVDAEILERVDVDGLGDATFDRRLPSRLTASEAWFQAVAVGASSNPVLRTASASSGAPLALVAPFGRLSPVPGASRLYATGRRAEGATPGVDRCALGHLAYDDPAYRGPTCAGCDLYFVSSVPAPLAEFTDLGSHCDATDRARLPISERVAWALDLDTGEPYYGWIGSAGRFEWVPYSTIYDLVVEPDGTFAITL